MDSRHLPLFLAVMHYRSIGRAAASLDMTQPAASRILKKLESEVGAILFERHSAGVVPTIYAECLLPFAEEVISNSRTALEEVAALKGNGVSIARVGAVASIASSFLPRAVDRLLKRWPNLRIQLLEAVDDQLSDALARGDIDIAIAGRMQHNEVPFSRPSMLSDTLAVIATRHHPLSGQSEVSLPDLLRFRWVLPPRTTLPMQEFQRRFLVAGLSPPAATVETRSVSAIRALVASTDMLSWQPRAILSLDGASGRIVELSTPELMWKRQFYVFKRQRGLLAPAALKLIEEMRAISRES
ncbi:LysR substrate-binding domain-containing protein [Methylocella tundrae]|uniref:LysR substrate-binding domain-containing protein n=1 Tax=Methylocella tundrae TaxID=227605 RepID=UPI0030FEABAF|nr:LysR substrate-binding domain-containing protein [Methylocella tundrae]